MLFYIYTNNTFYRYNLNLPEEIVKRNSQGDNGDHKCIKVRDGRANLGKLRQHFIRPAIRFLALYTFFFISALLAMLYRSQ